MIDDHDYAGDIEQHRVKAVAALTDVVHICQTVYEAPRGEAPYPSVVGEGIYRLAHDDSGVDDPLAEVAMVAARAVTELADLLAAVNPHTLRDLRDG